MVSIRLPGMPQERKLELPQWLPEPSEQEVGRLTDVTRLEEIQAKMRFKISKLEESNEEIKEFVKEEKKLWDEEHGIPVGDASAESGDGPQNTAADGVAAEAVSAADKLIQQTKGASPASSAEPTPRELESNSDVQSTQPEFGDHGRDRYQTSEGYYELVVAIFENNHLLDQMRAYLLVVDTRIAKLTMGRGMTL